MHFACPSQYTRESSSPLRFSPVCPHLQSDTVVLYKNNSFRTESEKYYPKATHLSSTLSCSSKCQQSPLWGSWVPSPDCLTIPCITRTSSIHFHFFLWRPAEDPGECRTMLFGHRCFPQQQQTCSFHLVQLPSHLCRCWATDLAGPRVTYPAFGRENPQCFPCLCKLPWALGN